MTLVEFVPPTPRLGIKLLCYNFMVGKGWSRTGVREVRGGAKATYFSTRSTRSTRLILSHDQTWANYECFIKAVMPTAEKCGAGSQVAANNFMFQLSKAELEDWRSQIATSNERNWMSQNATSKMQQAVDGADCHRPVLRRLRSAAHRAETAKRIGPCGEEHAQESPSCRRCGAVQCAIQQHANSQRVRQVP